MFVVSVIIYIGYDNTVVTKLFAEIWEHDDIAKKKSDGARNESPSIRRAPGKLTVQAHHLNHFIWR